MLMTATIINGTCVTCGNSSTNFDRLECVCTVHPAAIPDRAVLAEHHLELRLQPVVSDWRGRYSDFT